MMEMAILPSTQIHRLIWLSGLKSVAYRVRLMTSKVLDAVRQALTAPRSNTTEPYGAIRAKHAPAQAGGGAIEGNGADNALLVISIQKNSCQITPMILS
jgi:hypothetical protein